MWNAQDVGCGMFAGMWDVDVQNAFVKFVNIIFFKRKLWLIMEKLANRDFITFPENFNVKICCWKSVELWAH